MGQHRVLISGAGIAGSTAAYWLARSGFQVTVVERARELRSSGSPVDVHGEATEVARRMGVLQRLQDMSTHAPDLALVTRSGRRVGPIRLGRPRGDDLEIGRADLASILCEAAMDKCEFLFGDTATALDSNENGVDVSFERASSRRFDLVVGADGLHSTVRALAFGPEARFVTPLGLYIATMSLGCAATDPRAVVLYNRPGRLLTIHPVRGTAGVGSMAGSSIGMDSPENFAGGLLFSDSPAFGEICCNQQRGQLVRDLVSNMKNHVGSLAGAGLYKEPVLNQGAVVLSADVRLDLRIGEQP